MNANRHFYNKLEIERGMEKYIISYAPSHLYKII